MTDLITRVDETAADIETARRRVRVDRDHPHYKWVALSNTTLGVLLATINSSIVLISLPAIFRGIGLNPLAPGNVSYLLWMLMGYLLASAVLVVLFDRLGDMYGRVRIYNMGFVVFTVSAVVLSFDPFHYGGGAVWLIAWRVVQGVGGAMLMANSSAILTDAFPSTQRGLALGINQVAAVAGSFLGLLIGGVLSEWDWRAIFWVGVPLGLLGTVWSYRSLVEIDQPTPGKLDWAGTVTVALGLTVLLTGITYGIQPYGNASTGWSNPLVYGSLIAGVALLVLFCVIEARVADPMLDIRLFKNRAFGLGNLANLLASVGRGGLQFMLIIWLQGIWLPLRGYSYSRRRCGRNLLAAHDTWIPGGGAGCRAALGSIRGPPLCHRRHGALGGDVPGPHRNSGEFQLLGVRAADLPQRPGLGNLHRSEHGGHHVQRARSSARRGLGCAGHLLQRG